MSFPKSILVAAALTLATPFAAGCTASSSSTQAAEVDEADVVGSNDAKLKRDLEALLDGLATGGGEGDRCPYTVMDYKPKSGEAFNDEVLLTQFLPRMIPMDGEEVFGNMHTRSIADTWEELTSDSDRAEATKWRAVKKFFEKNLKGVRSVTLGWAYEAGGSIETGAVARVIVGQTSTGRVIAIWGIDIWT